MITVILPVRALEGAKARLSGVLNPEERRRLFTAMLQDVLRQVLRHPQLIEALGLSVAVTRTLMADLLDRRRLAAECVAFLQEVGR